MVVPVVLGKSSFDYTPMRSEQARLAKTLVIPSPRDKDDTSATLEIEDDQATPFKYPTFIKVRYGKEGSLPIFELWTKDNFDQEYKVSKEMITAGTINPPPYTLQAPATLASYQNPANVGTTIQGINDDPLVGGTLFQSNVSDSYAIDPITGDVYRNAYWDVSNPANPTIRDNAGRVPSNAAFTGQLIGSVKFDGVTGLALAAINTRIADISNAVEGVTKVLSVCSSNYDSVISLIR